MATRHERLAWARLRLLVNQVVRLEHLPTRTTSNILGSSWPQSHLGVCSICTASARSIHTRHNLLYTVYSSSAEAFRRTSNLSIALTHMSPMTHQVKGQPLPTHGTKTPGKSFDKTSCACMRGTGEDVLAPRTQMHCIAYKTSLGNRWRLLRSELLGRYFRVSL